MKHAPTTWNRIEEAELEVSGVTLGTGFGRSVGLRVDGKIYAIHHDSGLVVKLPRDRVDELIRTGVGVAWGPSAGRIMREWVSIPTAYSAGWLHLTKKARVFVASQGRSAAEGRSRRGELSP
jgi:hypothetical protein